MLSGFLAILLAIQSAPAQPRNDRRTWYQAYADAQRDIQQKNWDAAIADVEAASRLGAPKPGRNILFYGDVYRDFNPDYYLGIAYLNLNRYDDADRAFERVRQAQLIAPRDTLYAEFTRQTAAVKGALEKQAAGQLAAVTPSQTAPPVVSAPVPNTVVPDQTTPPSPTASNPPALVQQPPTQQPPTQQPPTQQPPAQQPPTQQSPIQRPTQQPPVQQGPVRPVPPRNTGGTGTAPLRPPTDSPSPPAPSPQERSALVDFFSGRYKDAANKLSALIGTTNASPRAYFYLACSRAALALTGKADATTAIADARAQLALSRDTGQYTLDKSLISPRIRQALGMQP